MSSGRLDAPLPAQPDILPRTHFAAAQLLEKKGMIPEAIVQYRKAVAVNHQYVEAYHALAVLLSRVGDHKGAVQTMAWAAKIRPDNPVIQNNYGYLLMHDEAWEKAIEQFTAAIASRPFFARAHVNRGLCLSKLGRFEAAFDSFRTVLPQADAHYNMGLMYRGQKRYDQANRSFGRVLEINPSFVAATQQLAEIASLVTRGNTELMGPPAEMGEGPVDLEPAVMVAQGHGGFVPTARPGTPSAEPVGMFRAMPVAEPSERDRFAGRNSSADGFDSSVGPTCAADFEPQVASLDEDMVLCAQLYFQEAIAAVATAMPRSARATQSMTVEAGPIQRVQPVDWGAAFSELWEDLPPDSDNPCRDEAIGFPREQVAFLPGMGFFGDGSAEGYFVRPAEERLVSIADPDVIRSVERRASYADPFGNDGYEQAISLSFAREVAFQTQESMDPMGALLAIEARIAMERSEQACLEQELGTFATGRWIDTSVASSAVADIPELNVRWTTTQPVRRVAPDDSFASRTMGSPRRDRARARGAGSTTLGMSIVLPPASGPEGTPEDVPCPEDVDGVLAPRGASASPMDYLFEIMSMASNDKSCWDATALQQMVPQQVVDTSPADWDDRGVAERDPEPYERTTLGSRVVKPERRGSDRVKRRARPTPRRYRLGKSTTKGMIEPVRN